MAYSVLENLLAQVNRHATILGKYWFVALYTCRIVIVCSIAAAIYSDEQSSFKCNTLQVGCENVCFNQISPISQIRFWAVQIIFTCAPTVIFVLWAVNAVHCMNNLVREIIQDRAVQNALDSRSADGSASELSLKLADYQNYNLKTKMIRQEVDNIASDLPSVLLMYILQLLLRIAVESFFTVAQFKIYGTRIEDFYLCNRSPCRVVTQCFMSRPKEKTIISWIMFGLTVWSILLSVSELFLLGFKTGKLIWSQKINLSVNGEPLSRKSSPKGLKRALEGLAEMNTTVNNRFYSDPINQDLRLNLPLEKCFLIFIQRQHKLKQEENEASDLENDKTQEHNEDEELEDLEDDYAYYYNDDDGFSDSETSSDEDAGAGAADDEH